MQVTQRRRKVRNLLRRANLWGYVSECELAVRARFRGQEPATRFLIFAQGRTGSRLLCELLDSHSQIDCDLEMLADPVRDVYGYVRNLALASTRPVYGFKVKTYQLKNHQGISDSRVFLRRLHDEGWRLIYLRRRNLFRQVYSGLARQVRGTAHSRPLPGGAPPSRPSVHLDVNEVIRLMRWRRETLEREAGALDGLPYKELVYEDDLLDPADQQRSVAEVVEWLGLDPEPFHTDMIPNTPPSLRNVIANFDEVEAGLRGTEFEDHFREAIGG